MTSGFFAIAAAALVGAAASTAARGASTVGASFAGQWRVAGVAVSDTGVQALADNDPSLMGKGLTFSPARLAWDQSPSTGDACINPTFTRVGAPAPAEIALELRRLGLTRPAVFTIRCQSGTWGPGANATIFRGARGVLAMPWYDGGLLKLVRR